MANVAFFRNNFIDNCLNCKKQLLYDTWLCKKSPKYCKYSYCLHILCKIIKNALLNTGFQQKKTHLFNTGGILNHIYYISYYHFYLFI